MRIIFVYNLKYERTTLNKLLNNGGLKACVLMSLMGNNDGLENKHALSHTQIETFDI